VTNKKENGKSDPLVITNDGVIIKAIIIFRKKNEGIPLLCRMRKDTAMTEHDIIALLMFKVSAKPACA
jgi:hypothetical protein